MSSCRTPRLVERDQQKGDSTDDMGNLSRDLRKFDVKASPYDLYWIHGINARVGVLNLKNETNTTLFYAASNCGVLYDWTKKIMYILQGHRNMVTNISSDGSGKWLVTADSGTENAIIVWDSKTRFPHRTLFTPLGSTKVSKTVISADAKNLLVLGYQDKAILQLWIWAFGLEEPHAKGEVDLPRDSVQAMTFNPYNSAQFALITRYEFWIGTVLKIAIKDSLGQNTIGHRYELRVRKPEVETNVDYGRLTCFTFVQSTSQLLVGTTRGTVLVYGYTIDYQTNVEADDTEKLRFIKVLKLEKEKINVIDNIENLVLIANDAGEIHFYDDHLKFIYSLTKADAIDNIKGISLSKSPRASVTTPESLVKSADTKNKTEVPETNGRNNEVEEIMKGSDGKKRPISVPRDTESLNQLSAMRDFVLCTRDCGLWFMDFTNLKLKRIMDFRLGHTTALSVHVDKPLACIGYANGRVELLEFEQHKVLARLDLRAHYATRAPPDDYSISSQSIHEIPELAVTCLEYSPSGIHLACGLNTGELLFFCPITIDILTEEPFKDTSYSVQRICFSCDSSSLAFADTGMTVCVYGYNCKTQTWAFVGKHRAHYKDVTCLFFTARKRGDHYRLFSIGEDRIMVEYDIGSSSGERLAIFSADRIDQSAVPLAAMEWPAPQGVASVIPTILVSNDEYKYKVINYDTAMTLATYLGPRYDDPVSGLGPILDGEGAHNKYMPFANKNVMGLQKLPLDGNPYKHVGVMAHPIRLVSFCFREDLGIIFTIGEKNNCLSQWKIRYESVEKAYEHGGTSLNPYYCLLEGGRKGWLFREMRDLFYYIQIICQGSFTTAQRRIGDYIPIDSLPDLMRALGFFPSQYEVENLLVEARYKIYDERPSVDVNFEEFVMLYINHRPAFGDSVDKIKNSFRNFAVVENSSFVIRRAEFIEALNNHGECFSNKLSWYLLSILYGYSFKDRAANAENDFSFLPENITISHFLSDIIGLQNCDNPSEE